MGNGLEKSVSSILEGVDVQIAERRLGTEVNDGCEYDIVMAEE